MSISFIRTYMPYSNTSRLFLADAQNTASWRDKRIAAARYGIQCFNHREKYKMHISQDASSSGEDPVETAFLSFIL